MTDEYTYTYEETGLEKTLRENLTGALTVTDEDMLRVREVGKKTIRYFGETVDEVFTAYLNGEITHDKLIAQLREIGIHSKKLNEVQGVLEPIYIKDIQQDSQEFYRDAESSFSKSFQKAQELTTQNRITFTPYNHEGSLDAEISDDEIEGTPQRIATSYTSGSHLQTKSEYPLINVSGTLVGTCGSKKYQPTPLCKHELAYILTHYKNKNTDTSTTVTVLNQM